MPLIINPGGRMVEIDDPQEHQRLLKLGFKTPTQKEADAYEEHRQAMIQNMKDPVVYDASVYLATVSPGGKDGYGVASAKLSRELKRLGVNISTSNQGQKIGLLFHAPYSLLRMENPFRIVYTMFESDKIPADWNDYLSSANKVLVPSKWCQNIFAKSGIETQVVPLGYDDTVFTYKEKENKRKKRKDFTFLHYNAYNIRKGFTEVLQAFTQEFGPDEPVKMIFKTTLDTVPIPLPPSQYPNIKVLTGAVNETELAELCQKSDCFVFPSRGEGFGITPLEAMATGTPAIVPNAHGITEYFDARYMYEVKVKEMCPALYARYKGQDVGKMVVCDVEDLRRQMRYIYEHQDEAIEMGKKASNYVKQWTFAKTAEQLKVIFEEIAGKPIPKRQLQNILNLELVN